MLFLYRCQYKSKNDRKYKVYACINSRQATSMQWKERSKMGSIANYSYYTIILITQSAVFLRTDASNGISNKSVFHLLSRVKCM